MPSTEIQRIVLLIGLGVVGYLLVHAWNQDHGQAATGSAPRAAPIVSGAGEPSVPEPASDVPVADDVPSEELSGAGYVEPEAVRIGRLVHVQTPMLEVWIDRLGGDIVGLQLPRYTETIGDDVPVRLLDQRPDHVHIAQSGLIGRDGGDKAGGSRPLYTAPASAYAVDQGTLRVTLSHRAGDVVLDKHFLFDADEYLITVEQEVHNASGAEFRARQFAQLKRDASRPGSGGFSMGPRPYVGAAFTTPESRYEKIDFDDLDDGPYRVEVKGGWSAVLQHYFLVSWVGDPGIVNAYYGRRLSDGNYAVGYIGPEVVVPPGQRQRIASARLYAGPKIQERLEEIAPNLSLTVDYGILWWLSVPLFYVLDTIHSKVGNWGVAIVLLTLGVKLLLYPLASAGFRSMARMKQVMPQMKRLQERHAGDRQKLSQEMMGLYRKEGVNPFGGCLPLLLQMPVFFALYWVLYESVELRHAPFVFWIEDLAAPDPFFVLPILYGVSFFAMQLLHPPPPDPMQARVMKMMPILFTVLFLFFPSGLVLYWLVNNVLSLAQQWHITRRIEKAAAA